MEERKELANMQKHITIVGALRIGYACVGFILACLVLMLTIGPGILAQCLDGSEEALVILTVIGLPIALFVIMLSLIDIIGGIGVLKHKNWARYLIMIRSVLGLFNFPIGTALGIYCIWVLAHDETARLFTHSAQQ
jgi:hypothetical protein